MKISSKSILSPGRAREHTPISLSTSVSRRFLRPNGSLKGGIAGGQASPMFPTGSRKRTPAFENPEPSSPKVTCIGQVRVKSKKKVKQARSLSRRRSGEVSFRRMEHHQLQAREPLAHNDEQLYGAQRFHHPNNAHTPYHQQSQECLPHRNQRWVHLPITICEALRAFGAEFSCLFPCRSSCFSTSEREKDKRDAAGSADGNNGQSSCGAVLARWLVALQDGEGGKAREIELVVGGDDERTEVTGRPLRSSRRPVFDDIEIKDEKFEGKDEILGGEEARVSICIPPKNALLLMRCRSDPTRVAALANRVSEKPNAKNDGFDQVFREDDVAGEPVDKEECEPETSAFTVVEEERIEEGNDELDSDEVVEDIDKTVCEAALTMECMDDDEDKEKSRESENLQDSESEREELERHETDLERTVIGNEGMEVVESSSETPADREDGGNEEEKAFQEIETERISNVSAAIQSDEGEIGVAEEDLTSAEKVADLEENEGEEEEEQDDDGEAEAEVDSSTWEKQMEEPLEKEQDGTATREGTAPEEEADEQLEPKPRIESEERETERDCGGGEAVAVGTMAEGRKSTSTALPDCLLMMMCEPKLSMEVSKETWICGGDFIRWLPERQQKHRNGQDAVTKKMAGARKDFSKPNPANHQPPRSSCSFPAAAVAGASMATMIEQKLVNAVAYEPFVLTRCKSEPMRAAAKLAPEACFWKNRKLEPHRRATFGFGAAGVGF